MNSLTAQQEQLLDYTYNNHEYANKHTDLEFDNNIKLFINKVLSNEITTQQQVDDWFNG